jgi:hypothetical protein
MFVQIIVSRNMNKVVEIMKRIIEKKRAAEELGHGVVLRAQPRTDLVTSARDRVLAASRVRTKT